jgi:undecaprenyl-diphosphatase
MRAWLRAPAVLGAAVLCTSSARADPPPEPAPATPPPTTAAAAPPNTGLGPRVWGPPPLEGGQHFTIDPVADGVLIAGGGGTAALLSLILSTGEITANAPGPTSNLLSFDRIAVTQTIDPHAGTYSTIGLGTAIVFAIVDPFLSGLRDGWDAAAVDAVMYAETIALTEALTDITKIAVRRPRPIDYIDCPYGTTLTAGCSATNFQLSFFSGHAATVASIGATASYLAFIRSPHSPRAVRPWLTLGLATALTAFVSVERVRAGEHFPTDVIAGSLAGAMVGVLVPHLHRHKQEAPPVWIGAAPSPGGGASLRVGGSF